MAAITVNVESNDKDTFSSICNKMGMNISTAINIFIKAVNKTNGIPFEVTANENPFYSQANISHILRSYKSLKNGEGKTFLVAENEPVYGKD